MNQIKTKDIELDLKSITDMGSFSGYGSVFSVQDKGNDIVDAGAFSNSLKEWQSKGRVVPTLWQHQSNEPIGSWTELKEDDYGLLGKSDLWIDDAPYAKLAYKGMKANTITGLSIGYRIKRDSYDKKTGVTRLHELDLVEISVVTNPMNDESRVGAVKSIQDILRKNELPTLKEFEDYLREAGFSHSQAKAIAGNGLTKLLSHREVEGDTANLLDSLKAFKL